jgi:hypothetical protein
LFVAGEVFVEVVVEVVALSGAEEMQVIGERLEFAAVR